MVDGHRNFYLERMSWAKYKWPRVPSFLLYRFLSFNILFFLIKKSNDWIILDRILHNEGFWENASGCASTILKSIDSSKQRPLSLSPLQSATWEPLFGRAMSHPHPTSLSGTEDCTEGCELWKTYSSHLNSLKSVAIGLVCGVLH